MSAFPINENAGPIPATGTTPVAPGDTARRGSTGAAGGSESRPFADVLASVSGQSQAGGLRFSRHALERVQRRGISLEPSTLSRLQEGVGRAASKGSRDSVVLVEGTAFVVSIANRTVLTAVPQEHMREQVFTNIDSAVIA